MGRELVRAVAASPDARLVAALEKSGHAELGTDAGRLAGLVPLGVPLSADLEEAIAKAEALIDFTAPAATLALARAASRRKRILVIGTTGLTQAERAELAACAIRSPIVHAANMSVGVNLLLGLTRKVAGTLGSDYDIEILEMHHRGKVDAPSGTALALGKAAAQARGVVFEDVRAPSREGATGARKSGAIGFASLRGGDVVGDHTVIFAGSGERIELTHRASDRRIYAQGALRAALWAKDKAPGLYSMQDVLGLS